MYIAQSAEEQELRMARLSSALNVMDKVWLCKEYKLDLECRCKCKSSVINAEVEDKSTKLTADIVEEEKL